MRYPRYFSLFISVALIARKWGRLCCVLGSTGLILSRKNKCQLILICQYSSLHLNLSELSPSLRLSNTDTQTYLIYMHPCKLSSLTVKMFPDVIFSAPAQFRYFVCAAQFQQRAPFAHNPNAHTQKRKKNARARTHLFQLAVTG